MIFGHSWILRRLKLFAFKNVDWLLHFASLFRLFVDLFPRLFKEKSYLLYSYEKVIVKIKNVWLDLIWLQHFDVVTKSF